MIRSAAEDESARLEKVMGESFEFYSNLPSWKYLANVPDFLDRDFTEGNVANPDGPHWWLVTAPSVYWLQELQTRIGLVIRKCRVSFLCQVLMWLHSQ